MRETDLAWAAGFFDGEGCVTYDRLPSGIFIRINASQNGSSVELEEMKRILGGYINGPYEPTALAKKERYFWRATGANADRAMEMLRPYIRGYPRQ